MTTSWEGKSRWPGLVLGKIKSLWSNSQGSANDGLNQLIGVSRKVPGRIDLLFLVHYACVLTCDFSVGSLRVSENRMNVSHPSSSSSFFITFIRLFQL